PTVDGGAASRELDDLKQSTDTLDAQQVEITPEVELGRINRDLGNLNKVLDGIERQKADPEVGLDIVQLQRDEARVRKAIQTLDAQKVEVEAEIDVPSAAAGGGVAALLGKTTALAPSAAGGLTDVGSAAEALGVGGAAAGPIALGVAVGTIAFKVGQAAGDVETMKISLDSLTGGKGEETLAFLQQWAAETPFTLDQASQSFRSLAAAGVPLKDIPSDLNKIGSVSAALGTDLGALTLPLSQMISTGRASYENIQQLVELSGVPAWQLLADNLGLTVEATQKLASEGKLGKESVQLLIDAMGQKFPTALADQAASFNGQMSSMQDNLTQVEQNIGTLFLPLMSDMVGGLNEALGPILKASIALGDLNTKMEDIGGIGLTDLFSKAAGPLGGLGSAVKGV